MASGPVSTSASAAAGRADSAKAPRLLLDAGPLCVARLVALGSRLVDGRATRLRMGAGALAMVSVRMGLARRLLGVLRTRRAEMLESEQQHRGVSPHAPVAQVDRAAVS